MPITALFNLGSLILGLAAWILPVISLARREKNGKNTFAIYLSVSFIACASSLCLQIFEVRHRVNLQDWAALLDNMLMVTWTSALLLIATIILNVIAINVNNKRSSAA